MSIYDDAAHEALVKLAAPGDPVPLTRLMANSLVSEIGKSTGQKTVERLFPQKPLMQQAFGKGGFGRKALALGSVAGLAGVLGEAGENAYQGYKSRKQKDDRFAAYKARFPDQAKMEGAKDAFNTLHTFAPSVTKDPVSTRAFIRRQLQFKEEGPQVADIKQLTDINKALEEARKSRGATKPATAGIAGAMSGFQPSQMKFD